MTRCSFGASRHRAHLSIDSVTRSHCHAGCRDRIENWQFFWAPPYDFGNMKKHNGQHKRPAHFVVRACCVARRRSPWSGTSCTRTETTTQLRYIQRSACVHVEWDARERVEDRFCGTRHLCALSTSLPCDMRTCGHYRLIEISIETERRMIDGIIRNSKIRSGSRGEWHDAALCDGFLREVRYRLTEPAFTAGKRKNRVESDVEETRIIVQRWAPTFIVSRTERSGQCLSFQAQSTVVGRRHRVLRIQTARATDLRHSAGS